MIYIWLTCSKYGVINFKAALWDNLGKGVSHAFPYQLPVPQQITESFVYLLDDMFRLLCEKNKSGRTMQQVPQAFPLIIAPLMKCLQLQYAREHIGFLIAKLISFCTKTY